MKIRIIIATHKPYWMPEDSMYLPVHVGAAGKDSIGFQRDDEGENISLKNANYCELTGLYWTWKNLDADYLGLVHYRRHFSNGKRMRDKRRKVISQKGIADKLKEADVLLPYPRNYRIETNYSQYVHAHHAIDLTVTRKILAEKYPEYVRAWDESMKKPTGHRFNMFVMKKDLFDAYCAWLFSILFELEQQLDISAYSDYDKRVFGFVSERLLDVWIETNGIKFMDMPYVFMENQNWIIKGWNFVRRKLFSTSS